MLSQRSSLASYSVPLPRHFRRAAYGGFLFTAHSRVDGCPILPEICRLQLIKAPHPAPCFVFAWAGLLRAFRQRFAHTGFTLVKRITVSQLGGGACRTSCWGVWKTGTADMEARGMHDLLLAGGCKCMHRGSHAGEGTGGEIRGGFKAWQGLMSTIPPL